MTLEVLTEGSNNTLVWRKGA